MMELRRTRGDIPEVLREAGRLGERHVATLISLAVAGPATVSELAARLDMSPAHTSLVVGELARVGLVERAHEPEDRRRIVVSLAQAALPAVAEMRRRSAAPLQRFLAEIDEQEADTFIAQLEKLLAHVREQSAA
jgi:DNA-binding MarR family transcriptional regulator